MSDTFGSTPTTAPGQPPVQLTRQGLQRLQSDLDSMENAQRPTLLKQVRDARLFMDSAAGAFAADAAQASLTVLDRKIAELQALIASAQVIGDTPSSTAQLGSTVTVRYDDGTEETLTLVTPREAEPSRGLVSIDSPAGQALLGRAAGDNVSVGAGQETVSISIVSLGH